MGAFIRFVDIVRCFNPFIPMNNIRQACLLLFLIVFQPFINHKLNAQELQYRQGELIIRFKDNFDPWSQSHQRSPGNKTFHNVSPVRKLKTEWNLWVMQYDYTKFSASDIIRDLYPAAEVLSIQKNRILKPRKKPNDPLFDWQWHHMNDGSSGGLANADFDSDLAWDFATGGLTELGDTIVICIIDDGLEVSHEDLKPNLWYNHAEIPGNMTDDDQNGYIDDYQGWNSYTGNDQFSQGKHGTAVTGLAAARGNNGVGICGISWNVKIMFVAGGGDEANAIESYFYPLYARRKYNQSNGSEGAFVVATNASWGSDFGKPEDSPLWCAMYDSLGREGIINVASTTNQNLNVDVEGDLPTTCPSDYLISVTNLNDHNEKHPNAGYGKVSIDLGAYGESTYSTYINNSYRSFGGTSAAAPQVTGAVGLLYSMPCSNLAELAHTNPSKAALEVKEILLNSSKPNASLKDKCTSEGQLNLFNASLYSGPIQISGIEKDELLFSWSSSLIYPIEFRYRVKGQPDWNDTIIYIGNQLKLNSLLACTEYEMQYKGLCSRYQSSYSPVRIYKTSGCCESIHSIQIKSLTEQELTFRFKDPSLFGSIVCLIRPTGDVRWDTFIALTPESEFSINGLKSCTQYEISCYSFCNGIESPKSELFYFTTSGCMSCTELNYCRRFRPSGELEWLESIQIDNDNFVSGSNFGYGNFVGTNKIWTLNKNSSHQAIFNAGYLADSSRMVVAAWIDYNQDGLFDDNENFAIPTLRFVHNTSYNFQIPQNAKTGITRMRVMLKYAEVSTTTPLPCFQSLEFGEYEDYCVRITDSECPGIDKFELARIDANSAELFISPGNSNPFQFSYRKLYSNQWNSGVTGSRIISLKQLDSCSIYEVKASVQCANQTSAELRLLFKTKGTDCIVKTEEQQYAELKIYPNPCTNYVIILNKDLTELVAYRYISPTGKTQPWTSLYQPQQQLSLEPPPVQGLSYLQLLLKNGKTKIFPVIRN